MYRLGNRTAALLWALLLASAWFTACAVACFGITGAEREGARWALGLVSGLSLLTVGVMRHRVEVGTDGILVQRGSSRTFVPYRSITDVQHLLQSRMAVFGQKTRWRVLIEVAGRTPVVLETGVGRWSKEAEDWRKDRLGEELAERVRASCKAVRQGGELRADEALLGRAQFSQLRAAAGEPDFRGVRISPGRLEEIASDPAFRTSTRAAAAAALDASGGRAGRGRMRVAADQLAEPAVGAGQGASPKPNPRAKWLRRWNRSSTTNGERNSAAANSVARTSEHLSSPLTRCSSARYRSDFRSSISSTLGMRISSTRRFLARPAGVALLATGSVEP